MEGIRIRRPENAGLSSDGLARLENLTEGFVRDGLIPGCVVLVARRGRIGYFKAQGLARPHSDTRLDTLYWLASLSKPLLAVVVLQLFDRGLIALRTELSDILPGFDAPEVAEADGDGKVRIVPARRKPTVHDVLAMTGGFVDAAGLDTGGRPHLGKVKERLVEKGVVDAVVPAGITLSDCAHRYSGVPLAFHPGEGFAYCNAGCTILAAVVEAVTSRPYADYLRKNVLDPLGMSGTTFAPAPPTADRRAVLFAGHDDSWCSKGTWTPQVLRSPVDGSILYEHYEPAASPPPFVHAGGGLYGTATDVYRLARMLELGGIAGPGRTGAVRLLSRESVRLMTTNRIGALVNPITGNKWGYMLTVQETSEPTRIYYGAAGAYGRRGISGVEFWVNPEYQTLVVFMTNVWWSFDVAPLKQKVAQVVNRAIL